MARTRADGIARIVTEIGTPAVSVVALCVLCGIVGAPGAAGILWGALLAVFCGVVPYVVLEIASRRNRITDRHVTQRSQRPWAFAICLVSVLAGFVVMLLLDAPALLMWALMTMLAGLVVAGGITIVGPKVSMHALCLTSFFTLASLLLSPWWLLGLAFALPLVVWSRLRLGHHSPVEVVLGTVLGAAVTWGSWLLAPI
ncbi:phosphatase PAP2 family protein [Microbacterium karelineae]|uniref:phosphatase PAP2 family protein n=1 Tax=Microbacterium karelineae TaxID=2654283 RepID=UPI0018D312FE|nr:phosphatase PAP2 family protein [Microbacterium karelineae]